MRYDTLPSTDLQVSCLGLGTIGMGTSLSCDASFDLLNAYVEAGGTYLDTAHVYADWLQGERHSSERTIGAWMRATSHRDRLIVSTKGGHPDLATPHISRLSPTAIAADLDESLACLGLERIDLYWLHRDDPARPVGEILETLAGLERAGKIRYYGCSNWQPHRIRAAHSYALAHGLRPFVASQILWSLAVPNRGPLAGDLAVMDDDALAFYTTVDMAVFAYTSQARGFFARAAAGTLTPELRRDFENAATLGRLARARDVARRLDLPLTAVILAFIHSHPFPAVPIIGPSTPAQLHDSLSAADVTLPYEIVQYLATGAILPAIP